MKPIVRICGITSRFLAIAFFIIAALPASSSAFDFVVVNALTDEDVSQLSDNDTIDLNQVSRNLNIRAEIEDTDNVASVQFTLDGTVVRKEREEPYSLAGDSPSGDYFSWTPSVGSHSLTVVALNSDGEELDQDTVSFQVSESTLATTGNIVFTLVDADSDQDLTKLSDDDEINLNDVGKSLNIRAEVQKTNNVSYVKFSLDGASKKESTAPYSLAGDDSGDYSSWTPDVGSHSLTVVAYNSSGDKLKQRTIDFEVTTETTSSNKSSSDTDTSEETDETSDTSTSAGTDDSTDSAASSETDDSTDSASSSETDDSTDSASSSETSESTTTSDEFDSANDLLSLHFDHCADKDDAHSSVADRVIVGREGIALSQVHVVSGACGSQVADNPYQTDSENVMDAAWGTSGWLYAGVHPDVDSDAWESAVSQTAQVWRETLDAGGDVWIAEGGQSDFSADVVRELLETYGSSVTSARIHLIQHSDWNELYTTSTSDDGDLEYVQSNTDYIRIADGNDPDNGTADLHITASDDSSAVNDFVDVAGAHSQYGSMWDSAFDYLDPDSEKLDFSDSVELLYILGIGTGAVNSCSDFADQYLSSGEGDAY